MNRDIIVIGASFGGIDALKRLLPALPVSLPASVFIVIHSSADSLNTFTHILAKSSDLPIAYGIDGAEFKPGQIYIAPSDHHMLLDASRRIRIVHGPKENRFRPAIDPLFRSAAVSFGTRVIGVVLSGLLDDGAAGLADIKACGGMAVVQDPEDAVAASMPLKAMQCVDVDCKANASKLGELLARLVKEDAPRVRPDAEVMARGAFETKASLCYGITPSEMDRFGVRDSVICPDCGGPLWKINQPRQLRYRCHLGHSYTAKSLAIEQGNFMRRALDTALRSVTEMASLTLEMAVIDDNAGNHMAATVGRLELQQLERDAASLRAIIERKVRGTNSTAAPAGTSTI